ncbi:MAG: IS5 family transposase [Syntrophales bacterium]|nr:IS5 family transposase [Syntrophales bacterium]
MRGIDDKMEAMFCYLSPEEYVPADHPLRPIRKMVDKSLERLSPEFDRMYSHTGRPSIAPEKLLKALLLQALYSIRSNRLLVEQIGYNVLFRWFLGMALDEEVWDHSTFSQNQERLISSDIFPRFFQSVLDQARHSRLLSDEHFSVDGTLIESWASMKSFQPKDGPPKASGNKRNPEVNFHGEKRTNETHASITDPDAKIYRKGLGKEAKLSYMGHVITENRNGLVVAAHFTQANGRAEREAAETMVRPLVKRKRITLSADKGYDMRDFIFRLRSLEVTPHVARRNNSWSAIDGRTTRHPGYERSQRARKKIEEVFGWIKTIGVLRKARYRGREKIGAYFMLSVTAYNLIRMRNLGAAMA